MSVLISRDGQIISEFQEKAKRLRKSEGIPLHAALDAIATEFYKREFHSFDETFDGERPWDCFVRDAWTLDNEGILTKRRAFTSKEKKMLANEAGGFQGVVHEIHSPTLRGVVRPFIHGRGPLKKVSDGDAVSVFVRLRRVLTSDGWIRQIVTVHEETGCFERGHVSLRCSCCRRIERSSQDYKAWNKYNRAVETDSRRKMACFLVNLLSFEGSFIVPVVADGPDKSTKEIERVLTVLESETMRLERLECSPEHRYMYGLNLEEEPYVIEFQVKGRPFYLNFDGQRLTKRLSDACGFKSRSEAERFLKDRPEVMQLGKSAAPEIVRSGLSFIDALAD